MTIVHLRPDEEEDTDTNSSPAAASSAEDTLTIPFQNENLYVVRSSPGKEDKASYVPAWIKVQTPLTIK